jgi:hypothetical protein
MITIYKICLTNTDIVDRENPKRVAKLALMGGGFDKFKQEFIKLFEATYQVDTDDLEYAFEATNLWEGYDVKRLKYGSGSSTVGDIFVKDGNCYFCDNFGWVAMGKYEGMN